MIAYLIGGIPFGLLIGRLVKGIDVRQHGSGNLGATNVFRVVGKKWGIFVLLLDAFKGYAACALPVLLAFSLNPYALLGLGVAAILGHVFPVWLGFKGGKGVATSLGVFLALIPVPTLWTFALWILLFLIFRIISLASLAAACAFPAVIFFTLRSQSYFPAYFGIALCLAAFIFYTHRANLKRLLHGEEKTLF